MEDMLNVAFAGFGILLVLWTAFWVIRLAVRYGVDDALRKHRDIARAQPLGERID